MASEVSVEFRPSPEQLAEALRDFAQHLVDRTAPNRRVAVVLDQWVQKNFSSEGGNVGGWTPFKYGGRRIPGGGIDVSAKLLQDTGHLRASFSSFFDSDLVGIGSDLFYAQFHEFGTVHLPARRMLPEEGEVIDEILRVYEQYVVELNGKGLI